MCVSRRLRLTLDDECAAPYVTGIEVVGLRISNRIAGPMPETKADRIREREEADKLVPLRHRPD
jgi:hypothetical protein